jgi:acetyltransferase
MIGHDVILRDGRVAHLRHSGPADEAEFLQAFERLSGHTRYMRFMRIVREPDREQLRKVLASFPEGGVGIVATVPAADGIDIVGSAVAVIGVDRERCEFAVTVAEGWGGTGLGTALMRAVIDEAARRGLKEMEGFVLAQNRSMLRLASRLGFEIASDPGDSSVKICRLALGAP